MLRLFSIYDSRAEAYMRPFCARNSGEALRAFADLANDPQHAVGQHPEDYSLWRHGAFDEETGELSALPKEHLGHAVDYVRSSDA